MWLLNNSINNVIKKLKTMLMGDRCTCEKMPDSLEDLCQQLPQDIADCIRRAWKEK